MKCISIVSILFVLGGAANAFVTLHSVASSPRSQTCLGAREDKGDLERVVAASAMAATFILGSTLYAGAALAFPDDSSLLLAARSGSRSGGRAARAPSPSSSRVYSRTTIIAPPTPIISAPVVVSPFGASIGYGYNPLGGFGLGYGLGAMNSIGDTVRDYRQESEIQREKVELEVTKQKQAELEARIRELEKAN